MLATNYFESGLTSQGEELLRNLEQRAKQEYLPPLGFTYIYYVRNDLEKAYHWTERACEEKDSFLPWCAIIPIEDYQIFREPSLKALGKEYGLMK
jgi:TPR repeat protein